MPFILKCSRVGFTAKAVDLFLRVSHAVSSLISLGFLSFPDGPPIVPHYDISDTNSDPEVVNVDNLLAAAAVQEHNSSVANQNAEPTWRTRGLLEELNAETSG